MLVIITQFKIIILDRMTQGIIHPVNQSVNENVVKVGINYSKADSLEKGISWLLKTRGRFSGGATFIIKKLNQICKNDSLERLWKEKIDEDLKRYPFFYRVYGIHHEFDPKNCYNFTSMVYPTYINFVLCEVVYCDKLDPQKVMLDIISIEEDGGFNSTHKLFSLLLMKEIGCYNSSLLNDLIRKKVGELTVIEDSIQEFEDKLKLDVYAERAALIGYAGYEIKDKWIENLVSTQEDNGSWLSNAHTTALSLWAIAQKNKNCD
jgi:hypothetical protein